MNWFQNIVDQTNLCADQCIHALFSTLTKKKKNRSWICRPSFLLDSLWLERPDACGSGLLRAGPSGKERCTPHHSVPVSPHCPQEIGLPTLPPAVLQGAAVSSERFSVSSAQKHIATPSGVSRAARAAVPCQSSALGNRASSSKHTRGQSQETGTLSRLFGSMETTANCVSIGPAHCRKRLSHSVHFQRGHSDIVGSRAGSGNGTRSEYSLEEGGHRGGPSSRQRTESCL